MELKKLLVIHPNDLSTDYLKGLYENVTDAVVLDETFSDEEISNALESDEFETVMMLGHGCAYGLFAPTNYDCFRQFGRMIINPNHADALRHKNCIAIWCNANEYAERYGLSGLFSGMVISELSEARALSVPVTNQIQMNEHNTFWLSSLNECVTKYDVTEIPDKMAEHIYPREMTPLETFNFNSLHYIIEGKEQKL